MNFYCFFCINLKMDFFSALIDKITPLLYELINKNSWLNPKLVAKVIEMAGE